MEVPPLRERLQVQLLVHGLVREGYCRMVLQGYLPAQKAILCLVAQCFGEHGVRGNKCTAFAKDCRGCDG